MALSDKKAQSEPKRYIYSTKNYACGGSFRELFTYKARSFTIYSGVVSKSSFILLCYPSSPLKAVAIEWVSYKACNYNSMPSATSVDKFMVTYINSHMINIASSSS